MNILVLAAYQGDGSPTGSFVHEQVKAFQVLGQSVRVLAPIPFGKKGPDGRRLRNNRISFDGVEHVYLRYISLSRFGARRINSLFAAWAGLCGLRKYLNGFVPDVIHSHAFGTNKFLAGAVRRVLDCPLVVTTHGSDSNIPMQQGRFAEMKAVCDRADHIVAVSSVLGSTLRRCGTDTPITTILNGFALRALPAKIEKQPCTLIQVSNLIPQKKVDITLRAFARLRERHPDAKLTVVGQGGERSRLEVMCSELDISDAVRFTGQLPNEQVLSEMSAAQFFVMPSVREGFGIVYLEAMASGCVTIGTQGEGISDLIVSGENGFLIPPDEPEHIADTIEWCLSHKGEASAIAEQGRSNALSLTWERNALQYIALFRALLERD